MIGCAGLECTSLKKRKERKVNHGLEIYIAAALSIHRYQANEYMNQIAGRKRKNEGPRLNYRLVW